jgi:hypothetical protein
MKYMAQIVEGKVVNVSLWDGVSNWQPSELVVEIPTTEQVDQKGDTYLVPMAGIGWDYVEGKFIDNRPKEEI